MLKWNWSLVCCNISSFLFGFPGLIIAAWLPFWREQSRKQQWNQSIPELWRKYLIIIQSWYEIWPSFIWFLYNLRLVSIPLHNPWIEAANRNQIGQIETKLYSQPAVINQSSIKTKPQFWLIGLLIELQLLPIRQLNQAANP